MQLDEVDAIHAQPLERAVEILARARGGAASRLGGEEEVLAVARHPRADAKLGVAVARGGVDVVDAVPEQQLQRAVGLRLARLGERGRAEEGDRAAVPGASERSPLDHGGVLPLRSIPHVRAPAARAIIPAMRRGSPWGSSARRGRRPSARPRRRRSACGAPSSSSTGQILTVKAREGATVPVRLADNYALMEVTRAKLDGRSRSATTSGAAAVRQADGTFRAQEVLIFPFFARGSREGHFPWDLTPTAP